MRKVHEIIINELRPTQITVGMIEVEEKRRHIAKMMRDHPHRLAQYVADHAVPTVAGYDGRYFLVDHTISGALCGRLESKLARSRSSAISLRSKRTPSGARWNASIGCTRMTKRVANEISARSRST